MSLKFILENARMKKELNFFKKVLLQRFLWDRSIYKDK